MGNHVTHFELGLNKIKPKSGRGVAFVALVSITSDFSWVKKRNPERVVEQTLSFCYFRCVKRRLFFPLFFGRGVILFWGEGNFGGGSKGTS